MMLSRRSIFGAATLLFGGAAGWCARAAAFPTKPIRLLTPFSAGTTVDNMARALAQGLEPQFGLLPVVVNRPGAAGLISVTELLSAEADGHTWLLSGAGQITIQPHLRRHSTIQPTDIAPVCQLYETPLVFVANKESGIVSFDDLLKRARDNPATVSVAHYGPGSATHLMMEAVARNSAVQFLGVSYRTQGQLLQDLLGGTVQAAILAPGSYAPNLFAQIVVLAPKRLASIPAVPTIEEAGQPLPLVSFAGIFIARTVAEQTFSSIEAACVAAAATETFKKAADLSQVILDVQPREVFAARIREQSRDMKVLIEQLGLVIE
jgi:tripartite-type tricarboxylate transporter receptor subunit TctC